MRAPKKALFLTLIILASILQPFLAMVPHAHAAPTLRVSYLLYNSNWVDAYTVYWRGMTFTTVESFNITSVKIYIRRVNTPGPLYVRIRATSGWSPTGPDLVVGSIPASSVGTGFGWVEISLGSGYLLDAETKYALIISDAGGAGVRYDWMYKTTGTYPGGNYVFSTNSGSSWVDRPVNDLPFEIWGDEYEAIITHSSLESNITYLHDLEPFELNLITRITPNSTSLLNNTLTLDPDGLAISIKYVNGTGFSEHSDPSDYIHLKTGDCSKTNQNLTHYTLKYVLHIESDISKREWFDVRSITYGSDDDDTYSDLFHLDITPSKAGGVDVVSDSYHNETRVAGKHQVVRNTTSNSMELVSEDVDAWEYRKLHNIMGSTSGNVTDYPVLINVSYSAGADSGYTVYLNGSCQADFDDVRFLDSDGSTFLDYWLKEKVDSSYATFWVEVNEIIEGPANTTIYLDYGNDLVGSLSDADATFSFFDDATSDKSSDYTWRNIYKGTMTHVLTYESANDRYKVTQTDQDTNMLEISSLVASPNYEVQFQVRFDRFQNTQFGVCMRYSSSGVYYSRIITGFSPDNLRITREDNPPNMATVTPGNVDYSGDVFLINTWYKVFGHANGSDIYSSTELESKELTIVDANYNNGTWGFLFGFGATTRPIFYFRNVIARNYIDPEPMHGEWSEQVEWLSGWDNRVQVTIDHNDIDATIEKFPVLLYLSTNSGRGNDDVSFIFDELGANSLKIAVTEADGLTECYVEVEKWDYGEEKAWLWVNATSIAPDIDTILYLYFDNDHADNTAYVGAPNSVPAEKIWDSTFEFVSHMRDDPDTSHVRDSTTNDNDGTKVAANNPLVTTAGMIDDAQIFAGDDYITVPLTYEYSDGFEFSGWIKLTDKVADYALGGWESPPRIQLWYDVGNDVFACAVHDGITWRVRYGTTNPSAGVWYFIGMTNNGAGITRLFVDASQEGADLAFDVQAGTSNLLIGAVTGAMKLAKAVIDSVRFCNVPRASAWRIANYETGRDDLVDFGAKEGGVLGHSNDGHFYTTDFLDGVDYGAITVLFNTTIPDGDSITVEFSQDNSTWYEHNKALGNETIIAGYEAIDLRDLDFNKIYFRLNFTDGGADSTPRLYQIRVIHQAPVGNGVTYLTGSVGIFLIVLCILIPIIYYAVKRR